MIDCVSYLCNISLRKLVLKGLLDIPIWHSHTVGSEWNTGGAADQSLDLGKTGWSALHAWVRLVIWAFLYVCSPRSGPLEFVSMVCDVLHLPLCTYACVYQWMWKMKALLRQWKQLWRRLLLSSGLISIAMSWNETILSLPFSKDWQIAHPWKVDSEDIRGLFSSKAGCYW